MVDESSVDDVVPFERVEEEEDMFTRPYSDHQEGKDIDINYRSILGMRIEKAEVLWVRRPSFVSKVQSHQSYDA